MRVLRGYRWGQMWVVPHSSNNALTLPPATTAHTVENEPPSSGAFDREEPETLTSFPACTVEWRPGDAEPFAVIDLLSSGPSVVKCATLREAEQKARRA